MRIYSTRRFREFWQLRPEAAKTLNELRKQVNHDSTLWLKGADVKSTFPTADLVGDLVVFNVGGNKYRITAEINFGTHKIFIKDVLTHAEYSRRKF